MRASNIEIEQDYAEGYGQRMLANDGESLHSSSGVASFVDTSLRLLNAATRRPRPLARQSFEQNGRYDADIDRPLRTSSVEDERTGKDAKHRYFLLVMENHCHMAPIRDTSARIPDLGTGSGDWCVEMARQYPDARIIGTDLSNVTPSSRPSNVAFEIEDFEDEWSFDRNSLDMVHHRFNVTAVSDWPRQFQKALIVLKPGGFIELVDIVSSPQADDNSIPVNSQLIRFFHLIADGRRQVGKDLRAMHLWRTQLEAAGYINVQERVLKLPIGGWPKDPRLKEAGSLKLDTLQVHIALFGTSASFFEVDIVIQKLLRNVAPGFFARVLRWKATEANMLFDLVRAELDDKSIHWWLPM